MSTENTIKNKRNSSIVTNSTLKLFGGGFQMFYFSSQTQFKNKVNQVNQVIDQVHSLLQELHCLSIMQPLATQLSMIIMPDMKKQ